MKVMAVSGSPIKDSNTDKAVQIVMEGTGAQKKEFFKLSDYSLAFCTGCLGCVNTNRCVLKDDGVMLAEKAYKADVLIVGGFATYCSLDSRTKCFLERLYPLHHRHKLMAEKPGAAVITTAAPPGKEYIPHAAEIGLNTIKNYMVLEGLKYVGGVSVPGNVPCVRCKTGIQCQVSGLKMLYGPEATLESVGIKSVENDPETVNALEELGYRLYEAYYGRV